LCVPEVFLVAQARFNLVTTGSITRKDRLADRVADTGVISHQRSSPAGEPEHPFHRSTRKPITKPCFFYKLITMFHELSIPLTMKIMALGHSLHEAQCLAAAIVFRVVLLCVVMGYRIDRPDETSRPTPAILNHDSRGGVVRRCGIFPARTGTAADFSRTLLFTH
jgi:hypothetical protein